MDMLQIRRPGMLGLGAALLISAIAPAAPPDGYRLIWSDEFDGEKLDETKWSHRSIGPRRDGINVKEAVSLDGAGHLVITTTRIETTNDAGDAVTEYHTGMIGTQSKFEHRYGYWECRAKLQDEVGHWSAFWIHTPTMGDPIGDVATAGAEIDVYEYLARKPNEVTQGVHYDGYGEHHKYTGKWSTIKGLAEGFHTFGLLWTPEAYVFYVDGRETRRVEVAISRREQYIILSLEVGEWAGDIAEANLPDSLIVDWVRVYELDSAIGPDGSS